MEISGSLLRDALISAANNIARHRKTVDALNVFPVPDGDTGTNMFLTFGAAKRELLLLADDVAAGNAAGVAASALLRGARGNSGVILSLLFRGLGRGLHGKRFVSSADLAGALSAGVESAYQAVMKPTEGTILTVARESAAAAKEALARDSSVAPADLWDIVTAAAAKSLEATPDLLPVLKKAGVVDAGGKGLVIIYEGMSRVFHGGGIIGDEIRTVQDIPDERNAAGEYEGEITFTYCTEFIVIKDAENTADPLSLRAYLESIGDSVVVADDDEIIKCHVHTDNPGNALQKALGYGQLTNLKIENMREQHASNKKSAAAKNMARKRFEYVPVDNNRAYGFVSVASGAGIHSFFTDLGVDNIVDGGQTMNPSTDDILEAIHATPAKTVIVLPNNKNIIMAAEQTVKLADRAVYVLPSMSIPQGLSALLAFDHEAGLKENQLAMVKAAGKVGTGLITFAARDSEYENHKIKKGEILALENNRLAFVEKDINKAVTRLARALIKKDSSFVTLIYGEDVSDEQAEEVQGQLSARLPDSVEFSVISGGQPVYYYILSVE